MAVRVSKARRAGRTLLALLALAATAALLAACGGRDRDPDGEPRPSPIGEPEGPLTRATIGVNGGTLASDDGRLLLTVPSGALNADTVIGIQEISNTAPHGRGSAYRLTPSRLRFSAPVTLEFDLDSEGVSPAVENAGGTAIGFQDADGLWQGVLDSRWNAQAGTVSAVTRSFSDWGLFEALRIDPAAREVGIGESLRLTVQSCLRLSGEAQDWLAPLLPTCAPLSLVPLLHSPSANGVEGGDATVGRVELVEGLPHLVYQAPAEAPDRNPVAVSVEVRIPGTGRYLLVADVIVQDEPCLDPWPGSCAYDLVSVAGEGLPYGELPRENEGDNPEYVIDGRLLLDDFEGDGSGSYTLRLTVREDRTGDTPLWVVLGDAGDYVTQADGSAVFTSLTEGELRGMIGSRSVAVERFPIWGTHSHLVADLEFAR